MDTNEKFVITISRELGSGGRTIGRKLAESLGVRYCDKTLIRSLRKEFGLNTYEIERIKGEKKNWLESLLDRFSPLMTEDTLTELHQVTTEEVFKAETRILQQLAEEGSCVIAGRSGFFVLDDQPNKVDIFITASRENRIARVVKKQNLTLEQAELIIDSVDKDRETYIQRFAGVSRYDLRNYDLVLNVDGMDEDQAVDLILQYLQIN